MLCQRPAKESSLSLVSNEAARRIVRRKKKTLCRSYLIHFFCYAPQSFPIPTLPRYKAAGEYQLTSWTKLWTPTSGWAKAVPRSVNVRFATKYMWKPQNRDYRDTPALTNKTKGWEQNVLGKKKIEGVEENVLQKIMCTVRTETNTCQDGLKLLHLTITLAPCTTGASLYKDSEHIQTHQ